jgi:hypothetical protein
MAQSYQIAQPPPLKHAGSGSRTAAEQQDWERQVDAMGAYRNDAGQVVITGPMPFQRRGTSLIAALERAMAEIRNDEVQP